MAARPAPGAPEDPPSPTALLIGSHKLFEKPRPVRGAPKSVVVPRQCRKGGRRNVCKSDGEVVPSSAFVEGDLRNMRGYLENKGVNLFGSLDYRHHYETGEYGDGKKDILKRVREFFAQNDGRTEFILYFSGHGDLNGSWCIAVSELSVANCDPSRRSQNQSVTLPPARKPTLEVAAEITRAAPDAARPPAGASRRPEPTYECYDLVTYDDIVKIWDEEKRGRTNRRLMMILDCCHSGRWVQMVNGECGRIEYNTATTEPTNEDTNAGAEGGGGACGVGPPPGQEYEGHNTATTADAEPTNKGTNAGAEGGGGACGVGPPRIDTRRETSVVEEAKTRERTLTNDETSTTPANCPGNGPIMYPRRRDICVQAACRPSEESWIANNQLSSLFTRSFITAQRRTTFEKFCISFFDHIFVLNFPSMLCSSLRRRFTPLKSHQPPFAGIKFIDSFDDMHLRTPG